MQEWVKARESIFIPKVNHPNLLLGELGAMDKNTLREALEIRPIWGFNSHPSSSPDV